MDAAKIIEEYEQKFNELISIPIFNMPKGKTVDDFLKELQKCIFENKPFDEEAFGIINDENTVY